MVEELIPIVMFVVIGVVLGLFYYFRYRTRAEMQQTVRTAIDKGHELTPELLGRLGEERRTPDHDLRRGTIAVFLAIGMVVLGLVLDQREAVRPIVAASALPLAIGLAYLLLWALDRFRNKS